MKTRQQKDHIKNILIYYIAFVSYHTKMFSFITLLLYLITNKIIGYAEESNGNKYLRLVATDRSNDALKTTKNYEAKTKILLNQNIIISQTIIYIYIHDL